MKLEFAFADETQKEKIIAETLSKFIIDTYVGIETSMYKTIEDKEQLKQPQALSNCLCFAIEYLNICYKSLILSNDEHLLKIFRPISQCLNHSEECALIMTGVTFNKVASIIQRENLKIDSLEGYIESLMNEITKEDFQNILRSFEDTLVAHFKENNCTGVDITTRNPDENLFTSMEENNQV